MGRAEQGTSGEYGYDQCDVNVKEKSDSKARVVATEKSELGLELLRPGKKTASVLQPGQRELIYHPWISS